MAQIAIIPATGSQAPPANSPVHNEQSQFSPHLENALSNKKQPLPPKNSNNSQGSPLSTENDTPIIVGQDASEIVDEISTMPTTEPTFPGELLQAAILTSEKPNVSRISSQPASGSSVLSGNLIPGQQRLDLSSPNSSAVPGQLHSSINETVDFSEVQSAPSSSSALLTTSGPSTEAGKSTESQSLLIQLQKIINNSNETGTVSISRTESSPAIIASTSETPAANNNGLLLASGEGFKTTTGRPDQQLPPLRLDSQQQYYEAKANLHNGGENNTNSQDTRQGGDTPQQPSPTLQQNTLAVEAEPASSFSQASVVAQETSVQTSTETAKTILLPSGTMVHEEEVVQQLIQRFQISGKLTDTKINIKLNPAELGELRIDIAVKDGSIKAHVVAQSQQAIEIIEKNISKLRTVLEDQGYSIDEISVTSESDSVGDFNLFDKQLFSQNDDSPPTGKETREQGQMFNPDHFVQDKADDVSGVNVRI